MASSAWGPIPIDLSHAIQHAHRSFDVRSGWPSGHRTSRRTSVGNTTPWIYAGLVAAAFIGMRFIIPAVLG